MEKPQYKKLNLKSLKDRSVLNFHPWIFSGAISTPNKDFNEGEVVEVFDASNKYLATGHFHHGTIMVRIISFEQRVIDRNFWIEKLNDAYQLRMALPSINIESTNAFRLIHGEGDFLPGLIIDVYGNAAIIQAHSEGMQLMLNDICEALKCVEGLHLTTIYNKSSESMSKQQGAVHENSLLLGTNESAVVLENDHQFFVNWKEGQKTGFFLDQRENRKLLATYCKNKSVLNTFCYSGGFSIYALKAGAKKVDSVDSSIKAIEWLKENIQLNFPNGAPHNASTEDVFDFIKKNNDAYDVIILDPPAFAKHLSAIDRAVIGYRNLNEIAIAKIKPGGIIFTFSCSQAIDKQLFRKTVFMAAAKTGRKIRILHQLSQGPDHPINLYHPEGEYLKGLVLRVD
jgi:23S rRNA (cytosine1962-C5)-methyltransferase